MSTKMLNSQEEAVKLSNESDLEDEDGIVGTDLISAKEMPLNRDAWSQALLAMVLYHDGQVLTSDQRNWVIASIFMYFVNIVIQIGIILMILEYVVNPLEADTQPPIFDINAAMELLRDPRLQGQTLKGSESYQVSAEKAKFVLSKCKDLNASGIFKSQLLMLFLWNARIMQELTDEFHLVRHLRNGDRRTRREQALVENFTLVRVDSYVLWLTHLLVQLPMLAIAVLLWLIGSKLIAFGVLPFTVVLKGLAMQFLVTIDELLFAAFAAPQAKKMLGRFKVRYHPSAEWPKWEYWGATVFKFSVAAGVTAYTLFGHFAYLLNFRSACSAYGSNAPAEELDKMR
eukprot:TRINITY_DN31362_c0_g1_i2.p1 TRINITY_DN31362_c0_g1~~TRINITY_DN31362_c0_g1_i2.p1  ORF type:complete len:343 (+),score=57.62 TRINITY_DN31362_c0_g1_i2:54-1082(+)